MANVFSNAPTEDDDQEPGIRVAGALTGGDEEEENPDPPPSVEPARGVVDDSAQSYLSPAGADEGEQEPQPQQTGSADTQAYMNPIPPPTLAKPADFADHSADQNALASLKAPDASKFRPSIGRRIGASLAAGAMAFGHVPGAETEAERIYAAPYQRAQEEFRSQQAPLQAKLAADQAADAAVTRGNANIEQQNRLAEQNYRNQSLGQQNAARAADYAAQAESRKNAITSFTPDDPANPYAGGTGTTADGRTVKGVPPPDKWLANWEKNPANAAQKDMLRLKAMKEGGVKLTPEQESIVASGGRITPNNRQPPVGEVELAAARAAFIKENGRPPQTLQEQNDVAQAAKGTLGGSAGSPATPETAIQQHLADKANYMAGLKREDDGSYTDRKTGDAVTPDQVAARLEKFRADLNNSYVMRKSGTMVDEHGNTVNNRFSRNPQQAAPQQQVPSAPQQQPTYKAKSGATVTVGTRVVVNGKPGVVTGFDANGKPIVK